MAEHEADTRDLQDNVFLSMLKTDFLPFKDESLYDHAARSGFFILVPRGNSLQGLTITQSAVESHILVRRLEPPVSVSEEEESLASLAPCDCDTVVFETLNGRTVELRHGKELKTAYHGEELHRFKMLIVEEPLCGVVAPKTPVSRRVAIDVDERDQEVPKEKKGRKVAQNADRGLEKDGESGGGADVAGLVLSEEDEDVSGEVSSDPLSAPVAQDSLCEALFVPRRLYKEHLAFLLVFPQNAHVLAVLNENALLFHDTYVLSQVPQIQYASALTAATTERAVSMLARVNPALATCHHEPKHRDILAVAVESYLLGGIHDVILKGLSTLHAEEDTYLRAAMLVCPLVVPCVLIRLKCVSQHLRALDMRGLLVALQNQANFADAIAALSRLETLVTPHEMLVCLLKVHQLILEAVGLLNEANRGDNSSSVPLSAPRRSTSLAHKAAKSENRRRSRPLFDMYTAEEPLPDVSFTGVENHPLVLSSSPESVEVVSRGASSCERRFSANGGNVKENDRNLQPGLENDEGESSSSPRAAAHSDPSWADEEPDGLHAVEEHWQDEASKSTPSAADSHLLKEFTRLWERDLSSRARSISAPQQPAAPRYTLAPSPGQPTVLVPTSVDPLSDGKLAATPGPGESRAVMEHLEILRRLQWGVGDAVKGSGDGTVTADDLLPLWLHVLVNSAVRRVFASVTYMRVFHSTTLLGHSEMGYALANFEAAARYASFLFAEHQKTNPSLHFREQPEVVFVASPEAEIAADPLQYHQRTSTLLRSGRRRKEVTTDTALLRWTAEGLRAGVVACTCRGAEAGTSGRPAERPMAPSPVRDEDSIFGEARGSQRVRSFLRAWLDIEQTAGDSAPESAELQTKKSNAEAERSEREQHPPVPPLQFRWQTLFS